MASSLTLQELRDFHSIDRRIYARLVLDFGFDSNLALQIVAFWSFLERKGYRCFVNNMLQLSDQLLLDFAMEAKTGLDYLTFEGFVKCGVYMNLLFPLMRSLVSEDFSMVELMSDRENSLNLIKGYVKLFRDRVFSDMILMNQWTGVSQDSNVNGVRVPSKVNFGAKEDKVRVSMANGVQVPSLVDNRGQDLTKRDENGNRSLRVSENDRTLFITFSNRSTISKAELRDLLTRKLGSCVESIQMGELFAFVVVDSASTLKRILGENDLVKLISNGNDVWLRRSKTSNRR